MNVFKTEKGYCAVAPTIFYNLGILLVSRAALEMCLTSHVHSATSLLMSQSTVLREMHIETRQTMQSCEESIYAVLTGLYCPTNGLMENNIVMANKAAECMTVF